MCVLRVSGRNFDPKAYLRTSGMKACSVHVRGEPRLETKPDGRRSETSGFVVAVSEAAWTDLAAQARDAILFVETHAAELVTLAALPEVEDMRLDFSVCRREVAVQCEHFPRELVSVAGRVGLSFELSLYPEDDDADAPPRIS